MLVIMCYGPAGNVVAIRASADYQVQDVWAVPLSYSDWSPKMAAAAERRLTSALMQWCEDRIVVFKNQYDHDRYRCDCRKILDKVPRHQSIIMSMVADICPPVPKLQGVYAGSPLQPILQMLEALRQAQQPLDELVARTHEAYSKPVPALRQDLSQALYICDDASGVLHHRDCPQCPTEGVLYGYTSIQRAVGRFPRLCACCGQDYRQALRVRNQKTVQKMQTKYLFNPETGVLHDPKCARLLSAYHICGIDDYDTAMRRGYRPCRICNPDTTVITQDKKRQNALDLYNLVCRDSECSELWVDRSKTYRNFLCDPRWAFVSDGSETVVHLRSCQCVYTLSHPKGYMHLEDAIKDNCILCPQCAPSDASDIDAYYPVYDQTDADDGPEVLQSLCEKAGYGYTCAGHTHTIKTPVGVWYLNAAAIPMTLEHRNLSRLYGAPKRHEQPVLFLRWRDVYRYIHRHDKQLRLLMNKKERADNQPQADA